MASRYDENTKARAVRLVREPAGDYETEWAAMKAISRGPTWKGHALLLRARRSEFRFP